MFDKEYGIDGGKKVKGRKQHIVIDTLGLPVVVKVHPANIHDSVGAIDTIGLMKSKSCLRKLIYKFKTVSYRKEDILHLINIPSFCK